MLSAYSSERDRDDMMNVLRAQPRPDTLCGERVPDSLNFLTYGQLDDLRSLDTEGDVVFSLCDIIFGKKLDVYSEDVNKVFGFVNFYLTDYHNQIWNGVLDRFVVFALKSY